MVSTSLIAGCGERLEDRATRSPQATGGELGATVEPLVSVMTPSTTIEA
jgi:hypothetical protein